ncbi:hypothetical protein GCM10011352_15160 [Marinobacterium zhoushanense]|uniref:DUF3080 family protein n=2 Tax=Marinobacterium zhoushanense TaxID=1679163 RepID=A0ABQ1KA43_9GAMM|nr:hypothetical protein GCM10011352_15160 [Marinobacterium zhoushanense]
MLERYTERVGNAIEEPILTEFDNALAARPSLPPKRQRLIEIKTISEGLIDVLDFRHCDLLHSIAERNTTLARLAGHSQRLIYELEVLPALRRCKRRIDEVDTEAPSRLKERLTQIIEQKQQSLGAAIWNALYASTEMEQHFALTEAPLPLQGSTLLAPLKPALAHFQLLAELSEQDAWDTPAFVPTLEQDFEALYRSAFGAQWITSLVLLTHTLKQTSDAIERRLLRRPICFNNRPNNQAQIIRNVFQKFYAGELQPYMSLVDRQGQEWLTAHQQILDRLPVPSGAQHYFLAMLNPQAADGLWQHYLDARDAHTRNWQRLLRQCGMMPGS